MDFCRPTYSLEACMPQLLAYDGRFLYRTFMQQISKRKLGEKSFIEFEIRSYNMYAFTYHVTLFIAKCSTDDG